jgi:D-sedoheptulose 7-phosphate isomerase
MGYFKIITVKEKINNIIAASIRVKELMAKDKALIENIGKIAAIMVQTFKSGGKVLFCGNGGSAADAQHIAAELSGRFYKDRDPLFAEALHVNTSALTAIANDFSFDEIYSRQVLAQGRQGDVLVCISTSGNSENIIKAAMQGKQSGMTIVGLTGNSGGRLAGLCDYVVNIPSDDTARIQESHILTGHILCYLVESEMFTG